MIFADHHHYRPADVGAIGRTMQRHQADFCVTTAKDWVKLRAYKEMQNNPALRRLEVQMHITAGRELLCAAIDARLADRACRPN